MAKVKEEVRRRQNERKNEDNLRRIEAQRRKTQIERLFGRFYLNQNGRLEMQIVRIVNLKSFSSFLLLINFFQYSFQINEVFKIFHHELENMSVKTKIDVKLNESLLPKYCFTKDTINFQRRLLRSEFVEVTLTLTKYFLFALSNF